MKFAIVFAALFAVALAVPVEKKVEIVEQEYKILPNGFNYFTKTSDSALHESVGELKKIDKDHEILAIGGYYAWVDEKTGQRFTVNYYADENGYRPQLLITKA